MGHARDADELLEVFGDELRTVVGDDAWPDVRVGFASALQDRFHVGFLHFLTDFEVNDEAAATIEDGAEEVESADDVEVADIDVPVFVGRERLDEAGAFFGGHGRRACQQTCGLEDAVDAGGAAGDDIGVEHHEGETAIAFERVGPREGADALLFVIREPMIAWHEGVVLVDLAEAILPVVEFAGSDANPTNEATSRDVGLVAPIADEIDDGIASIVGNPAAL